MTTMLQAPDPAILERKAVIDYILAVHKEKDGQVKMGHLFIWGLVAMVTKAGGTVVGDQFSPLAAKYGIHFAESSWWRFVNELRQPVGGDPRVAAFLRMLIADEALMRETLAATGDLNRVAALAAARGVRLTPDELRRYLSPFQTLALFFRELLRSGTINEEQWQAISGFASSEYSVYGDRSIDEEIFGAVRLASKAIKMVPGMGDLAMPIGVITGPWAAIVMHRIEDGRGISGAELERMFRESFMSMLEDMVAGLEALAEMMRPFG